MGTLFKRRVSETGWHHEDEIEQSFCVAAGFFGFYLPKFDTFVEGLGACPRKSELLTLRQEAMSAYKRENIDEMRACLRAMRIRVSHFH
jgi:hypothetical protein